MFQIANHQLVTYLGLEELALLHRLSKPFYSAWRL